MFRIDVVQRQVDRIEQLVGSQLGILIVPPIEKRIDQAVNPILMLPSHFQVIADNASEFIPIRWLYL